MTLSDDRSIVIDAKVPLDALLSQPSRAPESFASSGPSAAAWLHAMPAPLVPTSISWHPRGYWRQFTNAPEFVVLFLPAESLFGPSPEFRPGLLERAFSRNVVLATPTTLLALLRTIALGWRDRDVAENAAAIHESGRELHDRLRTRDRPSRQARVKALALPPTTTTKLVGS